jgi:hypothetical protein
MAVRNSKDDLGVGEAAPHADQRTRPARGRTFGVLMVLLPGCGGQAASQTGQ